MLSQWLWLTDYKQDVCFITVSYKEDDGDLTFTDQSLKKKRI